MAVKFETELPVVGRDCMCWLGRSVVRHSVVVTKCVLLTLDISKFQIFSSWLYCTFKQTFVDYLLNRQRTLSFSISDLQQLRILRIKFSVIGYSLYSMSRIWDFVIRSKIGRTHAFAFAL